MTKQLFSLVLYLKQWGKAFDCYSFYTMESLKNRLWNLKDPHGSPTGVNNKLNPQMTSPPAYEPKPQKWPHPGKGGQRGDGDDPMGEKPNPCPPPPPPHTHTHRSLGLQWKPSKSPRWNIYYPPKNPNVQALKFFHKGLNDITRQKTKKGS